MTAKKTVKKSTTTNRNSTKKRVTARSSSSRTVKKPAAKSKTKIDYTCDKVIWISRNRHTKIKEIQLKYTKKTGKFVSMTEILAGIIDFYLTKLPAEASLTKRSKK